MAVFGDSRRVPLRLLLVDDSPEVLALTRELLEHQGVEVVAVAADIASALRCAVALRPDVAIVDIDLGGESGFDLVERLAPGVRAVLTSTHAEDDFLDLIGASRALGFLTKSDLSAPAIAAIVNAHSGT